jgi:hypothetical protein
MRASTYPQRPSEVDPPAQDSATSTGVRDSSLARVSVLTTPLLSPVSQRSTSSAVSSASRRDPKAGSTCRRAKIVRFLTVLGSRPAGPCSSHDSTACRTV